VSLTPSKPRGVALPGDDYTDVTTTPAPWDGRDEDDDAVSDPDGTKQTGLAIKPAPGASVPTPTNKHSAASNSADYDLEPGTALGEYRIEQKIGQGGMGVVYLAVHPLIGKRAAIKILKKELCADPHQLERFIDEARVVNQIGHPNIVDVFAFGEMPDGRSYFVMEYLKGETLRARIARSPIGPIEVGQIVRPLARALEAAHEKGVIHRDLKPDNVFLVAQRNEISTVKLLDFGIAKLARNDHRVEKTATGAIVGTPQYIAPEQAKGYTIDHRADIYALGGIIYELLTGRPPFVADNAMEMVAKHLMETPLPPSQFAPSVAPELDDLVLRMLAKTPDGRPTLTEICDVVERVKVRASTQAPFGPPVRAESSGPFPPTPLPHPHDQSSPVTRVSLDGMVPPSAALSRPGYDAVVSQAQPTAEPMSLGPRRTPLWIAIIGVPLAGLAAFLIVSATGGSSKAPKPDPTTTPMPTREPAVPTPTTNATTGVPPKTPEVAPPPKNVEPAKAESAKTVVPPPKKVEPPKKVAAEPPKKVELPSKKVEPPPKKIAAPPQKFVPPPKKVAPLPPKKVELPLKKVELPPKKVEPPKKIDPPKKPPDGTELLTPGALTPAPRR